MVFVGVSLSDANMRRWLTWVHSNRMGELKQLYHNDEDSPFHYWINTIPADPTAKALLESVVQHLGVRIVWIDNWTQLGAALRRMLGM